MEQEREKLFSTQGLHRAYGDAVAVDNITLDIHSGEWVFLVGENGAGKSTFLRLLTREEPLDSGHVVYRGRDISRFHGQDLAFLRREVAVIWQDLRLIPNKTVRENVAFALEVRGLGRRLIRRLTEQALVLTNLQSRGDRFPTQLSGGEQQRVAIARSLVVPPRVLIADEPTSNLSPPQRDQLISVLRKIHEELGVTLVISTHDVEMVDSLRRRVVFLHHGRVVADYAEGVYPQSLLLSGATDRPAPILGRALSLRAVS